MARAAAQLQRTGRLASTTTSTPAATRRSTRRPGCYGCDGRRTWWLSSWCRRGGGRMSDAVLARVVQRRFAQFTRALAAAQRQRDQHVPRPRRRPCARALQLPARATSQSQLSRRWQEHPLRLWSPLSRTALVSAGKLALSVCAAVVRAATGCGAVLLVPCQVVPVLCAAALPRALRFVRGGGTPCSGCVRYGCAGLPIAISVA